MVDIQTVSIAIASAGVLAGVILPQVIRTAKRNDQ
jgi:hypothetical protein